LTCRLRKNTLPVLCQCRPRDPASECFHLMSTVGRWNPWMCAVAYEHIPEWR
ncbi:hypothetical protein BX616_008032, partial [Lobosporangium transversale]